MTRQRNQPRSILGFAALIALALFSSTTTAQTRQRQNTSLRRFQVASAENTISNTCLQVYNSPIVGCTDNEFINSACSPGCVRGVERIQQDIQDACGDVRTGTNTLLGQALMGNLVEALCGDGDATPSAVPVPGTTTVDVPTPPAAGRGGDSNSTPLNFLPSSTGSGRAPVNTNNSVGVVPGSPAAQPTRGAGADDDNDGNGDTSARPNGAGGSPFDIVAQDDAGRLAPILVQAAAVAGGVAIVLLR